MTRFKELRRIQRAIANDDTADLQWALSYCRSRIKISTDKRSAKYWSELAAKVEAALARESA